MRQRLPVPIILLSLLAATVLACSSGTAAPVTVRTSTPEPTATAAPATPTPTATPPATSTPTPVRTPTPPPAPPKAPETGRYESTQTGLFHVYNKTAPRTFDAPYNTYIQWWVGFDPAKANGFHSFLLDAEGKVVDAGTGRISNGCIRTGEAEAVFQYAEVGMPVFVRA